MWWRTLVAAFDASGFNHNDPRGGFQAARPELATYGKGGARFRDFRYRRLERL